MFGSGFATPAETSDGFNSFQNVSDGVANPVTLHFAHNRVLQGIKGWPNGN
jgi:hypothetical protein